MFSFFQHVDLMAPAQLVGYIATVVGIGAFFFKDDRAFKGLMAAGLLIWGVQYWMLEAWTSSLTSGLIASRQALSMYAPSMSGRLKTSVSIFYLTMFTAILVLTWEGARSIWPWLAAVNATYAMIFLNGAAMRKQVMLSTAFWLVNALIVGSMGHIITTVVTLLVNGWTVYRLGRDLRRSEDLANGTKNGFAGSLTITEPVALPKIPPAR